MIYYVIKNINDDQRFWSNEHGWVETEQESRFTQIDRDTFALPIGGAWCSCLAPSPETVHHETAYCSTQTLSFGINVF